MGLVRIQVDPKNTRDNAYCFRFSVFGFQFLQSDRVWPGCPDTGYF
jgi:hypothetical protein